MSYFLYALPILGVSLIFISLLGGQRLTFAHAGSATEREQQGGSIVPWYGKLFSWPMLGLYRDEDGKMPDPSDGFVGKVCGKSLEFVGIQDGSYFVAKNIAPERLGEVNRGDIVVAKWDPPKAGSNIRVRVFDRIDGSNVIFRNNPAYSKEYETRAKDVVFARVDHILP